MALRRPSARQLEGPFTDVLRTRFARGKFVSS
jgi:hypothetical protein